jgi:hypothetical protein
MSVCFLTDEFNLKISVVLYDEYIKVKFIDIEEFKIT